MIYIYIYYIWLVCGRTPSAGHGEGRDGRLKNFERRNHYKQHELKIFWLWRWSSTLLFKLSSHRLVKNTTLVCGWSYDDVN